MEKAKLRDLMESNIPKTDSYLSTNQFDSLFKALNPKSRETWSVGGAVCALVYRTEEGLVRIYRGNPKGWGLVQRRIAEGEFGIQTIIDSPLGSGALSAQMFAELFAQEQVGAEYGPPSSPMGMSIDLTDHRANSAVRLQSALRKEGSLKKPKKAKSKSRTRRKST